MIIDFLCKNYNASEKLKDVITHKLDKLDKFFDSNTHVKVVLKDESSKNEESKYTLELTIVVDSMVLRAEVTSGNMYSNIDMALPKLEKQIVRHHKKLASKSKKVRVKGISAEDEVKDIEEDVIGKLVRSKTYALAPMSVDDAISDIEMLDHSFYVFLNSRSNAVNVLYRRKDGNYGLIETVL